MIVFGENKFVVIGGNTNKSAYSPDGSTWTLTTLALTENWLSLAYGNGRFIVISDGQLYLLSNDGINWNQIGAFDQSLWRKIAYLNNRFILSGIYKVSISLTGEQGTWTDYVTTAPIQDEIAYGNGAYVTVANGNVYRSTDAITWNVVQTFGASFRHIEFGNGIFVIIENLYTKYSYDGLTWYDGANLPASANWNDIQFGDGKFVIVATNYQKVAVSTDASYWDANDVPAIIGLYELTYGCLSITPVTPTTPAVGPATPAVTPIPVPAPIPVPTPAPTPTPIPSPIAPTTPIAGPATPLPPIVPVAPVAPEVSAVLPAINFPTQYDSDSNLYATKDSLRLMLAQDYNLGDISVVVENNPIMMALFPDAGIITLTENCSEPEFRAISFYYTSKTNTTFEGIKLLDEFVDSYKPKNVTNVTLNVVAQHHNAVKNALKTIQNYVGVANQIATKPLVGTIEQRINYIRSIAYNPKPWFNANATVGIVPLEVYFTDLSFNSGKELWGNDITYTWDFGDGSTKVINYSTKNSSADVTHTYQNPGIYTVTLTVTNEFGTNVSEFPDYINARYEAPDFATIVPELNTYQIEINGQVKTPNNINLYVVVTDNGENAIDPVTEYNWILSDVLSHPNNSYTNISYPIGGVYDLVLQCLTENGSYRITQKANYINVIELKNYYLFTYGANSNYIYANEFGLLSHTFKTTQSTGQEVFINDNFLQGTENDTQAIREFSRNSFSTLNSVYSSGYGGSLLLNYATGRDAVDPVSLEKIISINYNAFNETYNAFNATYRPWNWIAYGFENNIYYLFGNPLTQPAGLSLTNQQILQHDLTSNSYSVSTISGSQYLGSSGELKQNPSQFDDGTSLYGYFSVYRTAFNGRNGYILRNSGIGDFFKINSFYKTKEDGVNLIYYFEKLADIAGPEKLEGGLVNLSSGLYFFNNTGSVSAYNPNNSVWQTGGPGINSLAFKGMQDTTKPDYNNPANTLVACSDNDHIAYVSFDYTDNSFIQFSDITLTFSRLPKRVNSSQWHSNIF